MSCSSIDDFEFLNQIGVGAFSKVYKVKRKIDNEIYALKQVNLSTLSEKEKDNAFTEIKILSSIDNPHIIAYKDSFIDKKTNTLYLIMEYAAYGDLDNQIAQHIKNRVYFSEKEILNIITQILIGLKGLHEKKILHRDLKAANIFICDKNLSLLKIGDLNVSKFITTFTMKNTQTGTPYYASPEVWNNRPYDYKSDIWSLGCLFYEITSLTAPFKGKSMKELYEKVEKGIIDPIPRRYSDNLMTIIKMCLRHDDKLRPSASELLDYVRKITGDKGNNLPKITNGIKKIDYKSNKNEKGEHFKFPESRYKSELRKRPLLSDCDTKNEENNDKDKIQDRSFNIGRVNHNEMMKQGKYIPSLKKINYHYVHKKDHYNTDINIKKEIPSPDNSNKDNKTGQLIRKKTPVRQNLKLVVRDKTPLKTDIDQKKNCLKNKEALSKVAKMRSKLEKNKDKKDISKQEESIQKKESYLPTENDNKEKINEMKNEIENILKFNIEQSKELAQNYLRQQQRSKSAINKGRRINNCSDNIKGIFEGYSMIERNLTNNKSSNALPVLNNSGLSKAIETTKVNNSFQMFNIFHYQIANSENNPKNGKIKKPSVNHYYDKEKLKKIKSKIGPMLKKRNKQFSKPE